MNAQAIQSQPYESNIYLSLTGSAATGILPAAVVCKYRKQGQVTLTTKTLTSSDWVEVGFGYYILKWSAQDLNTAGSFFFTLSGIGFDNFTFEEISLIPPEIVPDPAICMLTGNLRDVSGRVPANTRITARMVAFPARYGQSVIQADVVFTVVDASGQFELPLVRNAVVVLEIDRAGIKNQITVPDQASVDLIDVLPPFVLDFTT